MNYLISNIKEISHDNIVYYNNANIQQKINLIECSKNWVEYFNNNIDDYIFEYNPKFKISIENNKCVGIRDWFAEKPYFEFFSNPRIIFEIRPKRRLFNCFKRHWQYKYHSEFNKISLALQNFGWTTFDLG